MNQRGSAAFTGVLLLLAFAYFFQSGGWNQNARLDMARAIVVQGTIRIDAYHENTGDKALVEGHWYSDKAPGVSFLSVPVLATARSFGAGRDTTLYLCTLVASAVPTVLAALCILWIALSLGASPQAAQAAALIYGLATPAWAYATLFMGHGLAAGGITLALAAALELRIAHSPRRDVIVGSVLGAAGGLAALSDYPAGPAAVLITLLALAACRNNGRRMARVAASIAATSIPFLVALLWYHNSAFGSPLATPLAHLYTFPEVSSRPFGLPSPSALWSLLFGFKRGLIPLAPVMLAAPIGLYLLWRQERLPAVGLIGLILYYLIFNASFATPLAGWSYGPRYLAPALPPMCIGIAIAWSRARPWQRRFIAGLAVYGGSLALMAVSVHAFPPENIDFPIRDFLWPAFVQGELAVNPGSWNWGTLVGLHGKLSLAPLFLLGAIITACGWHLSRTRLHGRKFFRS